VIAEPFNEYKEILEDRIGSHIRLGNLVYWEMKKRY